MNDVLKFGKKIFTFSVVAVTIVWSMGLVALVPTAVQAEECPTLEAGDLFTVPTSSAVYLVTSELKRQYFSYPSLFNSWFENFDDVQNISTTCGGNYPGDGGVPFRAGSVLVKNTTFPAVYAILPGGVKAHITSPAVAVELYGEAWEGLIVDAADSVLDSYATGAAISTASLLEKNLYTTEGSDKVYLLDGGELKEVEGTLSAVTADDVRTVAQSLFDTASMSSDTVTESYILADVVMEKVTEDVADGELSVSLSASTPDTVTVPGGSQGVEYLAFNVTAGDEAVELGSLTIKRAGLGNDDDISKVYIYQDGTRLGNGRTLNSDHEATFTLNVTIGANQMETFMVKADMATVAGSATAGDTNYFEITNASAVDADADISGSFPIRGNAMGVGSQDIGGVAVTASGSDTAVKVGQDEVVVGQFVLTNNSSSDDVHLTSVRLENKGTAALSVLSNITLMVGGTELATGDVSGDFVDFELSETYEIEKSDDATFKVYADVGITDVDDTFRLILDETSDLELYSELFDGNRATVTNTSLDNSGSTPGTDIALTVTVEGGKINVDLDGTNEDIRKNANNVSFGTFMITATAENIDVDSMTFELTKASGDKILDDVRIRDINGNGSYSLTDTDSCASGDTACTYTAENVFLEAGVDYEFEILADTATDAANGDAYYFTWSTSNVDAETASGNTVSTDDFSSASLIGPTMTIANATLTVRSLALADKTVVAQTDGVLMFRGELEAGSTSDIKITSLSVEDSNGTAWDNRVESLKLYIASEAGADVNTETDYVDSDNTVTSEAALFDGINRTVEAGSANKVKFEIYADIGSTTGTVDVKVTDAEAWDIDEKSVNPVNTSGTVITSANVTTGRDVTITGSGSLALVVDTDYDGLRNDHYVLAGTAKHMAARVKVQADNENIKLKDLVMTVATTTSHTAANVSDTFSSLGIYSSADLSDDSLLASVPVTVGNVTLEDVNFTAHDDETHYLYLALDVNSIGSGDDATATSSVGIKLNVDDSSSNTAEGISSKESLTGGSGITETETQSNEVKVVAVRPVTVASSFAGGTLSGGDQTIFTFTMTAENGENTNTEGQSLEMHLSKLAFNLSTDVGDNVENIRLCRVGGGNCITLETSETLSSTTTTVALQTSGDTEFVNITDFATASDEYIDEGEVVEFAIKATVSSVTDKYLQVSLQDVNGSNFEWTYDVDNDGTDDVTLTDMRRDEPRDADYPDVVGGALN